MCEVVTNLADQFEVVVLVSGYYAQTLGAAARVLSEIKRLARGANGNEKKGGPTPAPGPSIAILEGAKLTRERISDVYRERADYRKTRILGAKSSSRHARVRRLNPRPYECVMCEPFTVPFKSVFAKQARPQLAASLDTMSPVAPKVSTSIQNAARQWT